MRLPSNNRDSPSRAVDNERDRECERARRRSVKEEDCESGGVSGCELRRVRVFGGTLREEAGEASMGEDEWGGEGGSLEEGEEREERENSWEWVEKEG